MTEVASTYVPNALQGWWGGPDLRVRCTLCSKVVFDCQEKAEASAAKTREREYEQSFPWKHKNEMQAYLGSCGHWHVGHSKRKQRS